MESKNKPDVDAIFLKAIELPHEKIPTYLDEVCGTDSELRARVEQLLNAQSKVTSFLESPARELQAAANQSVAGVKPGAHIGPYKLREQIGKGGFGVVYVAEQREPVSRKVALKIIKPGMDSQDIIARFEAEQQALAMMDHPNVAKVLDAGTTELGRPYFVMELIHGVSITEFCDQQQLSNRQRLELFIDVCRAVQHAHQKGVIHRDLKPSNIMVTMHDHRPVPKVIDFGVAKALHHNLTDKSVYTAYGQMVGTPMYMSPEQAQMSGLDVDTCSDVYSLGVLMYELLTGTAPFDQETFKQADFDEIRRIIREDDPPRPSDRVSTLNAELQSTISDRRKVDRRLLRHSLRGDLDWIVMKALEKDRARRYETAIALADDITRHIDGKPILACPPSATYRIRKFVSRNRASVTVAAVMVLLTLSGIVSLFISNSLIRSEQAKTQLALRESETSAARMEAVLVFVEERILAAARPVGRGTDAGLGKDVSLRRAIESAIPYLDQGFPEDPLIEARLRETLGASFRDLGQFEDAMGQFRIAHQIHLRKLGPDHENSLHSVSLIALTDADLGQVDIAIRSLEDILPTAKQKLGVYHLYTIRAMQRLADLYARANRITESREMSKQVVDLREDQLKWSTETRGPDHVDTLGLMQALAMAYSELGEHGESYEMHSKSLALMENRLGRNHPITIDCLEYIAEELTALNRDTDALPYYKETLERREQALGPDDHATLRATDKLGIILAGQGKLAEAEPYFRKALDRAKLVLGEDHHNTLSALNNMGVLLWTQGKLEEAEPFIKEALEKKRSVRGNEHSKTINSVHNLGWLLLEQRKLAEAEPYLREAVDKGSRVFGEKHPARWMPIINLAAALQAQGKYDQSAKLLESVRRESANAFEKGFAKDEYPRFLLVTGQTQTGLGEFAEAEKNLLQAHPSYVMNFGPHHRYTNECTWAIVDLYSAWNMALPNQGHAEKADEWERKLRSPSEAGNGADK